MLTIGRAAAVLQGIIWVLVLSHGGWGFILGPVAVAAAALAHKWPWASVGLLAIPVGLLAASWAPILRDSPKAVVPWLLLVAPAAVSMVCIIIYAWRIRRVKARS